LNTRANARALGDEEFGQRLTKPLPEKIFGYWRQGNERAIRTEHPVGREHKYVRMKVHQVAEPGAPARDRIDRRSRGIVKRSQSWRHASQYTRH
jgi:hypothetical protein